MLQCTMQMIGVKLFGVCFGDDTGRVVVDPATSFQVIVTR